MAKQRCWSIDVDGRPVRIVGGDSPPTPETQIAMAELVRAVRRRIQAGDLPAAGDREEDGHEHKPVTGSRRGTGR